MSQRAFELHTVREPYDAGVSRQLADRRVDHAIAVLLHGETVVGYTMCHRAGPKNARLRCECVTP